MAIFTLQDLRSQVSEEYASKSDEELVLEYARGTGQDPFKVASKFGVKTGMGRSAIASGASAGVDQVQAMAAGAGAAVAEALGATGLRNTLESEVRAQQAQAALSINPEVPQRVEDIQGVGDALSYAGGQFGQQIPIMGGIAAAGLATGGLGFGAGVGALGTGYMYGVGSLYNESVEGGERDASGALLGGIPYAAAEAAVPFALGRVVRGLGVPGVAATREINLAGGGATTTVPTTRLGRGGKALVGGAVAEGATEAFQTELEIGMRDDLSPEEIASRRLNAVVAGALVGGGFSGAVSATFKPKDAKPDEKVISTPEDILRYKEQYIEEQRRLRSKLTLTDEQLDEQVDAIAADTNGVEELEKLAKQRMNSREREATRLELKAAEEKLAELNQTMPEDEALAEARDRLAKLEAESSPNIGKRVRGRKAAKLRKAAEQRAQETAEERRDLEIAIASMEFDQRNEYSEQGAQLFALEYHIDKLRDSLEVDARGKAARKALVRVRKGRLTPEQGQAQVEQAQIDREANLEAAPVEEAVTTVDVEQEQVPTVEPTSPIVEPAAVQEETRGEVVQTTAPEEELVTEEEVEEAAMVDDSDVAQVLKAEVSSKVGKVSGDISLPQQVLKGVVEMMRSTKPNPKPIVRQQGSPARDADTTDTFSAKMTEVHEAFKKAVVAARAYNNARQNLVDAKQAEGLSDQGAVDMAGANAEQLQALAAETKTAMDELVRVAGSANTVDALIAINKLAAQKDKNKSSKVDGKIKPYMKELFGEKARTDTRGQYLNKVDVVLSNAWAAYKDGALEGVTQTAPEGRQKRLSSEEVDAGFIADLETAATEGKGRTKKFGKEKGLRGILNLVGAPGRGTPRVGTLALRKMLIDTLRERQQDASVKFTDEANSYYDPKDDTVYLRRATTPEEIVHESLHVALQGYVYRNQTAPEVTLLKNTLTDIVDFVQAGRLDKVTSMSAQDKQTAIDVVNTLQNVRGQQRKDGAFAPQAELDAVLELISYGNTLSEFKELTTKVKARDAESKTFLDAVNNVWRYLTELVSKFLGVENTAANDILNSTVSLLNKARKEGGKPSRRGKVLKQSVRGGTAVKPAEQVDLRKYGTQGTYGLTKPIFDLLGKALPQDFQGKLKTLVTEVREAVIKAFPGAEKILRKFNPQLAFGETLKKVFQMFKNEKHTGVQLAELVSNHLRDLIQRDIATAQKFIDYLDGNKAALNGVPDAELLKTRADNLLETIEEFKTALPETYKQFFDGRKFSESLIFVEKETDIGSGTVGQRKLSQIFGGRKQDLEKNDNPEWLGLKKEGDVFDSSAVYYRVMGETQGRLDPTKTIGFVREDQANAAGGITIDNDKGESFPIDMNAKWSGKDLPGKRFTFTTNKSVAEALKDANKMQAADQIGVAILNTANTLGTYYASKKFLSGLANIGRNANGNIDPAAFERGEVPVVFKDVAEYNRYLEMTAAEGETVRPYSKEVQTASAAELQTGAVADEFRRQGTLIKIPDTTALKAEGVPVKVWGDLAGKIVSGPVYAAIQDMSSKHTMFDKGAMRTYNEALRQFKLSKTTRNPGTHITNVASNVSIMMMHGITFKTLKEAASILYRVSRNRGALTKDQLLLLKEFEKSGALLGNFSASEVKKTKYREMRDKIKPDNDNRGVMGRVSELLRLESDNVKAMGNYILEKDRNLLELYAAEDNVFRLAAFMNRAGELQSANDGAALTADQWRQAGDFGRDAFLNYDIDAKYLQYARQTVMPFASWTYAAIPMLGKIAVTRPWMIANVLTSYALLDAAMSALAGEDEEDRNRLGKIYNEKLFFNSGPNSMIRIPFMGDDENPVYFRLGDYIPLSSTMRGTPAGFLGYENWPGGFSPNGPLVMLAGMFMNTDTYTGKKINDPTDSALDVTLNNIGMVVDMALPPVISTRNVGKAIDFIEGGTTISGRDVSPMLFARAAGLKFYNPNVTEETMYKQIAERQIIRDYGIAVSRVKREELRSGAPDYDALYAEIDSLRQEMREEIDKLNNRD